MIHSFQSEQWLPYPLEEVFAFFANPQNLPRLMPPWQRARIERMSFAPQPTSHQTHYIVAGSGARITLSFRPFPYAPFRLSWQAEISEFTWNHGFCDTQLHGPFTFWKHCHTVTSEARTDPSGAIISGTLLRDEIQYSIPFGKLGDLAQSLFIARQLRKTFSYRRLRVNELLYLA